LTKKVLSSTAKSSSPKSPSETKLGVAKPKPSSKGGLRVREQHYVGIDLRRRRSVIVRMNDGGEVLEVSRIDNDPVALSMAVAEAGPDPEVALEACYGWYWAADLLAAEGARVHLVHPLGLHWDSRRVKNDVKDATELAHRLRRDELPEAWIAPPEVRDLRELVRYRAKLTAVRTSAKAQIHAVMAKLGIISPMAEMFGPGGQKLLNEMDFPRRAQA
jgi:transposase